MRYWLYRMACSLASALGEHQQSQQSVSYDVRSGWGTHQRGAPCPRMLAEGLEVCTLPLGVRAHMGEPSSLAPSPDSSSRPPMLPRRRPEARRAL